MPRRSEHPPWATSLLVSEVGDRIRLREWGVKCDGGTCVGWLSHVALHTDINSAALGSVSPHAFCLSLSFFLSLSPYAVWLGARCRVTEFRYVDVARRAGEELRGL